MDLRTPEGLRQACLQIEQNKRTAPTTQGWLDEMREFLQWVAAADEPTRATLAFQERLWDQNPVTGVGRGNISMAAALAHEPFRLWLAHQSVRQLPGERKARTEALIAMRREMIDELKEFVEKTPHLKIFRVLAAFFPGNFTTVADRYTLKRLYTQMGGLPPFDAVAQHEFIREKISDALGPLSPTLDNIVWEMALPWYLYEAIEAEIPEQERVSTIGPKAGEETLLPLPAARRRRGLTAIKGNFTGVLSVLQVVKEGVSRDDLLDYLRSANPDHKENSLRMIINILRSEMAVIRQVGDQYQLTDRGLAVLESSDAGQLGDWLVTRILGIDHVLKTLEQGKKTRSQLLSLLQRVNPGWTSTYAPNALLNWLLSFRVIEQNYEGELLLSPTGRDWSALIQWEPELLVEAAEETAPSTESIPAPVGDAPLLSLPSLDTLRAALGQMEGYPAKTLEHLHLGLWSPSIRHFAVLTGISGSGKTRLAVSYAEALTGTKANSVLSRVHVEAVQPAWYDPTPLLGYVSPLKDASYTRTGFLNFLLRASADPGRPYVAILDEMNLSHPEQYFAPLLSAMEISGPLRFHAEADNFDGLPNAIAYPGNLAIIGTINMDETTHGLSDKVLDRAFTLEFSFLEMSSYPNWDRVSIEAATRKLLMSVLSELLEALHPVRLHFGWRVVDDVIGFVTNGERQWGSSQVKSLLDTAVYAKIIPKLRGEDSDLFRTALDQIQQSLHRYGLEQSQARVADLAADLRNTGSARFWR